MSTNKLRVLYQFVTVTTILSFFLISGCADLTQVRLTPLNNTILTQPHCVCHKGHVFAIRGFLGIWSTGMNTIAARTAGELHIPSTTIGCVEQGRLSRFIIQSFKEKQLTAPIILVGHSLGSDAIIDVAWDLYYAGIPVHLVMTDPVMPRKIPPNVVHCYNVYKCHPKTDFIPIYRGVTVKAVDASRTKIENVNIREMSFDNDTITHFNIEKARPVQDMILADIERTEQRSGL